MAAQKLKQTLFESPEGQWEGSGREICRDLYRPININVMFNWEPNMLSKCSHDYGYYIVFFSKGG